MIRERNLKSQRNQAIRQRHEEISHNSPAPADRDEFPEFDRRLPGGRDEFAVDREEEGEAEEGEDDEVDEADGHGGGGHGGGEGPETVH